MRFFIIPKKFFKIREEKEKITADSNKKMLYIILVTLGVLVLLFSGWLVYALNRVPSKSYIAEMGEYSLLADSKEQREVFLKQFGYDATEVYRQQVTIPSESETFEEYNKLQKSQGLDLYPYSGKTAQMYTMQIEKTGEEELFAVIIVYKGKVIGGHITDMGYPADLKSFAGE